MVFNQRVFEFSDEFVTIRRTYDKSDNKDLSIHHICEYVMYESKKSFYKQNGSIYNYFGLLNNWIIKNSYQKFIDICKTFYSTIQIKNWFYQNLTDKTMQVIYLDKKNNEIKNLVKLGSIKPKRPNLNRYNSFVIDNGLNENQYDYEYDSEIETGFDSYSNNTKTNDLTETSTLANIIVNLENEKQSNRNNMMLRQNQPIKPIAIVTPQMVHQVTPTILVPHEQNQVENYNDELKNHIILLEKKLGEQSECIKILTEENTDLILKFKNEIDLLLSENNELNNKFLQRESETAFIKQHLKKVIEEKNKFIGSLKYADSTGNQQTDNNINEQFQEQNKELTYKLERIKQGNAKLTEIVKCLEETNLKNKNE